jgi:hypothetical protein
MRLRTARQYWNEERQRDPHFPLGLGYIRSAIADGRIPSISVGNRRLFDADRVLEYLMDSQMEKEAAGIRRQSNYVRSSK